MTSRRNFLRALATGAAVGIVAPAALAELLAPKRTIFLPPRGGWRLDSRWLTNTVEFDGSASAGYNAGVPGFFIMPLSLETAANILASAP